VELNRLDTHPCGELRWRVLDETEMLDRAIHYAACEWCEELAVWN
jgi:hypothetical protein